MTDRRWIAGGRFQHDGIHYRVRVGRKHKDDLVLDHWTHDGWRPVSMTTGMMMADFFYENEEVLYPTDRGAAGGGYYLGACWMAAKHGWRTAAAKLAEQKKAKSRGGVN